LCQFPKGIYLLTQEFNMFFHSLVNRHIRCSVSSAPWIILGFIYIVL
jgi:hypothetical protein